MDSQPVGFTLPTSRSFDGLKRVLFQPFDIGKWFVLGFTAWLASLLEGGGSGNFNFSNSTSQNGDENVARFFQGVLEWIQANMALVITIASVLLLFGVILFLVFLWLSSRGKFMFLDNVVHNRARVKIPWSEFRSAGNSLFLWRLGFTLMVMLLVFVPIIAGVVFCIFALQEATWPIAGLIILGCLLLAAILVLAYITILLEDFVIPLMYRNSLTTTEAWRSFGAIHRNAPWKFVLYALWKTLLSFGAAACIIIVGLVTCCIGFILMAIPYLGAVILLPVSVFFRFLGPEFIRQFGSDYDIFPAPPEMPTLTANRA